ncbi:MAG: hypothetical protein WCI73_16365, partial [Phycisphaerae bacterium]
MPTPRLILTQIILLASFIMPSGCAPAPMSQTPTALRQRIARDLDLLADRQAQDADRLAADAQIIQNHESLIPSRLVVLQHIIYLPGQSPDLRRYALAQLTQDAPNRLEQTLYLHLPAIPDDSIDDACRHVAKLLPASPRLADALILRLDARPSPLPLAQRPEATTLLAGGTPARNAGVSPAVEHTDTRPYESASLTSILQSRLLHSRDRAARVAAIHLLTQSTDLPTAGGLILQLSPAPDDSLLRDIQHWYRDFHTLPQVEQEAIWLQQMYLPAQDSLMKQALASFHAAGLAELPPRLLAALAHTDSTAATLSRQDLAAQISLRLRSLRHQRRTPQYQGAPDDYDESLDANLPKLTHADLLAILQLLHALEQPGFRGEILRLGLEDRADTTTEHGGWITWAAPEESPPQSPALWPVIVPPLQTGNDQAYIASDRLLDRAWTALAIFHFHFQEASNAPNAGPGMG